MDDIRLPKVGEQENKNELPRGVFAIVMGEQVIFARRALGRFVPLPENEQQALREKHVK